MEQLAEVKRYLKNIPKPKTKKMSHKTFNKVEVIGEGFFGKIWKAVRKSDGEVLAIKEIDGDKVRRKGHQAFLECEMHLSQTLFHPHIVTSIGHFMEKGNVNIVQELCVRGSIFKWLNDKGPFPEAEAAKIIHEMASALAECHRQGFLHGDLKPENILLTDGGQAILCDFGLAWPISLASIRGWVGTVEYFAPEIFKNIDYDEKIDSWALGILCFELLVGKTPYPDKRERNIKWRCVRGKIALPTDVQLSQEGRDFMDALLQKDPQARMNIQDAMFHDWILKWHHTWV